MKKYVQTSKSKDGFTLFEVIVTIVIAAILGSILITFMGKAITRSSDPIFQAQNTATAKTKMEEVVADYTTHLTTGSTTSWNNFITNHAAVTTGTINNFLGSNFTAIEVTVTEGDQTFVAYFTQ